MKSTALVIIGLIGAAWTGGCDKPATTSQRVDQLQAETKAAGREFQDYSFAQKKVFTEELKTQLAGITRDLDQLSVQVEQLSVAARAQAHLKLLQLRNQATRLSRQVEQDQTTSASAWENVKQDSRKAYDELQAGFNQARRLAASKQTP